MATDSESRRKMADLMEKLRARAHRSWDHTSKVMRNSNVDKRQLTELSEKSTVQQHLDVLQKAFKVTNVVSMVERLESLARTVNLKYVTHGGSQIVLSSDMFWVEIVLDNTSLVKDVIISHNGDAAPRSCPEFVDALSRSDFEEVQAHLEGLISIYQINGDKKQRTKILHTIQALETDLQHLSQLSQSIMNGVSNSIHKSPVGILQPRVGGKPMRLTYFVGPYDLLDEKTGKSRPLTVEEVTSNQLGYSATIGIEGSAPRKLQYVPVMTVQTVEGKTLPSFSALTHVNSGTLPAVFVLCLHQPVPLSLSVVRKIQNITNVEFADLTQTRPLLSLILSQMTRGKQDSFDKDKGLFVTLSDQQHCYFMNGINGTAELAGLMVSQIPFTHPCNVAKILYQLRQQVIFNSFIGSCMRPFPKKDLEHSLIFEVTPISLQHVSVTFEHPVRESMATAEFDLSDPTNVRCHICSSEEEKICTDEYACKVIQRSLSLPVTMRSILQKATANIDHAIQLQAAMAQTAARSKLGQERRTAFVNTHNRDGQFTAPVVVPKSHPDPIKPMDQGFRHPNNVQPDLMNSFKAVNDQISRTPILANLLDQDSESPEAPPPSMLSALLGDAPAPNAGHKPKKQRKRRVTSDAKSPGTGKSPKRKMSEDDANREFPTSMDVDYDGSLPCNPHPQHRSGNNSSSGSQTPNEDFGVQESHVSRLASTLNNIIKAESKNCPGSHPQQAPQETGTIYMNEVDVKDVIRIKEENGGEGVPIKREPSPSSYNSHSSKALESSLVALLNDSSAEAGGSGEASPPNSVVSTQVASYSSRISQNKHIATNSPKNSLVSPQGLPTPASAGLATQITTKSSSVSANRKSLSRSDSYEFTSDTGSKESTSNSLLAKIMSDWPDKSAGGESGRRQSQGGGGGSSSQSTSSSNNSSSHSKSSASSSSSSSSDKKYSEERSSSSNKASDSWEDRVIVKEKVKRERNKEDHESGSSSKPPQEREKLGMTFKLNKDQTATAIVKASPSRDSPHHSQDGEAGRGSSKESTSSSSSSSSTSSSSSSSKASKEFKPVKASPGRIYDLVDDSPTNPNLARTMFVATDGKPGSPSIRIKKIRHDGSSSSEKKRKSKHSDMSDMGKRKKEDGKKDKSSGKRRKIYDGSSEFSDSKSVSNLKYSLEKGSTSTSIKITSASGKIVQSSSKSSSANRSSSKSSLGSTPGRPSCLLKPHMSDSKSSKSNRSLSNKAIMRSKSESQAMKMGDSKLNRTPTIKLKPLVIPGSSTTVTVTNTKAASTAPISRNSTDPMAAVAAAALAKGKQQKLPRKNLTAVIDKLTKQQNTPGSGPGGLGIPRRESPTPPFKKDPIAEKIKLEAIRKEIIRAGNKSSTPTKELPKSSQRKDQSFSLDKVDRKNDHLSRSSLQSSNSLQKGSSKLPSNNTTKIGLMSKVSSSGGTSGGSSSGGAGSSSQNSTSGDASSSSKSSSSSKEYTSSSSMSNSKSSSSSSSGGLSGSSNNSSSSSNSESVSKSKSFSSSMSSSSSSSNLSSVHHGSSDSYSIPRTDSTDPRRESNIHKDSYRDSHSSKDSYKDSHNSLSYKDGHSSSSGGNSSKEGHRDFHSRESSHKDSHKDSQKESSSSSSSSSNITTTSSSSSSSQLTPAPSSSTTQLSSSSVPTSSSSSSPSLNSSTSSSASSSLPNTTHVKDSTAKESSSLSSSSNPEKSRSNSSSNNNNSSSSSSSSKASKLEDHSDRTQSRHFLDAVTKIEHSSSSSGSHKDGERKSTSRGPGENSRTENSRGESSRSESSSSVSRSDHPRNDLNQERENQNVGSSSDKSKTNGQISNHGSRTYEGRPVDPRLYKDELLGSSSSSRQESSRLLPGSDLVNGSTSSSSMVSNSSSSTSGSGTVSASSSSKPPSSSSTSAGASSSNTGSTSGGGGSSSSTSGPSGSSSGNSGGSNTTVNHSSAMDAAGSSSPPCNDKSRLMVLNSDLSNSEDKENKEDDKLFKAPTPKSGKNSGDGCDVVTERHEVKVRREKPVLSPVSSPEDGLVIDCPGTPGNRSVRSPGPKSNDKSSPNNVRSPGPMNSTGDSSSCRSPISVVNKSPRSPSPRKPVNNKSPSPSPNAKSPMMPRNSPLPAQNHSPCEIDDELMDAALML